MNKYVGWLNVYKPINISSFGVLKKIKKKFNLSKIGHAGTLDPLAEGILPIAIGKITKLIPFINDAIKEYEFEIKWGEQTLTDDREGEIINVSSYIPKVKEICNQLKSFRGSVWQSPPKASAVKIGGQRAYKLLRTKKNFETKKKLVEIYEAKFIDQPHLNISKIKIICGKGFYIRSFTRDLGEILNTKAHVYSLKRTKVGKFTIKNSILLDDLLKMSEMAFGIRGFHSSISMLDDILAFEIDDKKILDDISHGRVVEINRQDMPELLKPNDNKVYLLKNKNVVVSLGRFDGNIFKPQKVFI